MVRAEVAGVLFTNDPITGNFNRMVLDASFGLGEVIICWKNKLLVSLFSVKCGIIGKDPKTSL